MATLLCFTIAKETMIFFSDFIYLKGRDILRQKSLHETDAGPSPPPLPPQS